MTYEFKKIGIWGRLNETNVARPALRLAAHLRSLGIDVRVPAQPGAPEELASMPAHPVDELPAHVDLIVTVGGDGTMLHAARRAALHGVPLIGVNLGRLGFLTDITPEHMLETIEGMLRGDFRAEDRLMLQGQVICDGKAHKPMLALNDVVLQKGQIGRMQDFVTSVDGNYVNTHGGDGLIVATATGSTAYALSCGGPIIQPHLDALVIVPVCPHTLSDRPLVLKSSSKVEVRVDSDPDQRAYATCDGEQLGEMRHGDILRIEVAGDAARLLHPLDHDYYEVLRSKLNWGRASRAGKKPAGG